MVDQAITVPQGRHWQACAPSGTDANGRILHHKAGFRRQAEGLQAQRTEWREQAVADKDFGGDKLADNLAAARRARDAFASPELTQLLEQTGLGDHPEVIRLFVKTGKAMSEDGFVTGRAGGATRDARTIYSASNMNP